MADNTQSAERQMNVLSTALGITRSAKSERRVFSTCTNSRKGRRSMWRLSDPRPSRRRIASN